MKDSEKIADVKIMNYRLRNLFATSLWIALGATAMWYYIKKYKPAA